MPAPVNFNLALAPLPSTYDLTPQQFAQAIVDRISISASEPWSSFSNGGSMPSSDIGPWLKNGQEWMVWDPVSGTYISHVQDGSGIRLATAPLGIIAPVAAAGSVLVSNSSKIVSELLLSTGATGQFLQNTALGPAWATVNLPTNVYFEVSITSANQQLDTHGGYAPVLFDTVLNKDSVNFDAVTGSVEVQAGEVWYFYTSLQVEDSGVASTGVQIVLRIQGATSLAVGAVYNVPSLASRVGFGASGIIAFSANDLVKVYIEATEDTPAADGLEIAANSENTRFGGFRIK